MQNDINSLKFYIYNTHIGIYVDSTKLPINMFDAISIHLDGTISDDELFGDGISKPNWYQKLLNKHTDDVILLEIDFNNTSKEQQRRFLSLVKDGIIDSNTIPKNTKIIIYSDNINNIDKELLSYLAVV